MKTLKKITLPVIALSMAIVSGSASAMISEKAAGILKRELELKVPSDPNPKKDCEDAAENRSYKRFCSGLPGGNNLPDYTK